MRYREIQPSDAAGRFVRCYWMLEDDTPEPGLQRIIPDGRAELILNLGHPYEARTLQPKCFLMGQITGPLFLRATGPVKIIGVRFHPHAASQLLNLPISELTDAGAISLDDISQSLFRDLGRIEELRSPLEWFPTLDNIMNAAGERAVRTDSLLAAAVKELEQADGLMSVAAVADRTGLSARQFERRFSQSVGIAPKLFSRMQRFQRVFRTLEGGHANWADAAVQCGYYDQAHLIRDFREFAGKPPAMLLASDTDLARHFVEGVSKARR